MALETQSEKAPALRIADAQPAIVAERGGEELKLVLGEFAGPLDLLLYLIRQEKVAIYDLPIALITAEYLRYLRLMQHLDINVAGDFLVVAATLIEIKSKMLLPRPVFDEADATPEEDPRAALVKQLLEHQKYQAAAQMLWSRATVEQAVFRRGRLETDNANPEITVGVFDLIHVFQKIMARRTEEITLAIQREELSLAQMLELLRGLVRQQGRLSLNEFFAQTVSRSELVAAFLAALELVKAAEITLTQTATFGDIIAQATPSTTPND